MVTLALAYDIDAMAEAGLLPKDWQKRLPDNSSPYTSTVVFLVRKGNPKGDQGLERPREAGHPGDHAEPEDLRRRALELPRGVGLRAQAARRHRRQGEGVRDARSTRTCRCSTRARAARRRRSCSAASATCCSPGRTRRSSRSRSSGPDKVDIVVPSLSILAEPPVAVVDKVVDKKGTRAVAQAYLEYLYTPEGQEIAAKNYYRPRLEAVAKKYAGDLPEGEPDHDRRGLRRLAEGAEGALRGRRGLRPDLPAQVRERTKSKGR